MSLWGVIKFLVVLSIGATLIVIGFAKLVSMGEGSSPSKDDKDPQTAREIMNPSK